MVKLKNQTQSLRFLRLFTDVYVDLRLRDQNHNPNDYVVEFDPNQGIMITTNQFGVVMFGADAPPTAFHLGDFHDRLAVDGRLHGRDTLKRKAIGRSCLQHDITLDAEREKTIRLLIVGGSIPKHDLLAIYGKSLKNSAALFEQKKRLYSNMVAKCVVDTPSATVNRAVTLAKVNLQMAKHDQPGVGKALFAGYPWFTDYWGRDLGWILPALDVCGDFEWVEETLFTLAKFQSTEEKVYRGHRVKPGEVPNRITMDGTAVYYSVDATPLFIMAVWHHLLWSGNLDFTREIYPAVLKAVKWGFSMDEDGDGFLEHYGDETSSVTWMDSYRRAGKAVDVQALWCHSLRCASQISEACGDSKSALKWKEESDRLKSALNAFWNPKLSFMYDSIGFKGENSSLTVNSLVPLLFNLTNSQKALSVLDRVEREFTTDWGVRTRSMSDSSYDARSYHKGSVWGLTTGWAAIAELNYDKPREGFWYLEKLAKLVGIGAFECFPELLAGDEPLSMGGHLQAWSASVFIQAVVEHLLGLNANALQRSLVVNPCLIDTWKETIVKNVKVGDITVNVSLRASEGEKSMFVQSDGPITLVGGFRLPKACEISRVERNGSKVPVDQPKVVEELNSNRLFIAGKAGKGKPLSLKVLFQA
jgi:hypothetical protein